MLVGLGVNTLGSRSEVRTAVGCTKNEIFAYQRQTEKKYFKGKKDMKHLQTSKEIIRAKHFTPIWFAQFLVWKLFTSLLGQYTHLYNVHI